MDTTVHTYWYCLLMEISYLVLFGNFFYHSYSKLLSTFFCAIFGLISNVFAFQSRTAERSSNARRLRQWRRRSSRLCPLHFVHAASSVDKVYCTGQLCFVLCSLQRLPIKETLSSSSFTNKVGSVPVFGQSNDNCRSFRLSSIGQSFRRPACRKILLTFYTKAAIPR